MDEEYDVIVLGTGLTVSNAFRSLMTHMKQMKILSIGASVLMLLSEM